MHTSPTLPLVGPDLESRKLLLERRAAEGAARPLTPLEEQFRAAVAANSAPAAPVALEMLAHFAAAATPEQPTSELDQALAWVGAGGGALPGDAVLSALRGYTAARSLRKLRHVFAAAARGDYAGVSDTTLATMVRGLSALGAFAEARRVVAHCRRLPGGVVPDAIRTNVAAAAAFASADDKRPECGPATSLAMIPVCAAEWAEKEMEAHAAAAAPSLEAARLLMLGYATMRQPEKAWRMWQGGASGAPGAGGGVAKAVHLASEARTGAMFVDLVRALSAANTLPDLSAVDESAHKRAWACLKSPEGASVLGAGVEDPAVWAAVMHLATTAHAVDDAEQMWDEMSTAGVVPDAACWAATLRSSALRFVRTRGVVDHLEQRVQEYLSAGNALTPEAKQGIVEGHGRNVRSHDLDCFVTDHVPYMDLTAADEPLAAAVLTGYALSYSDHAVSMLMKQHMPRSATNNTACWNARLLACARRMYAPTALLGVIWDMRRRDIPRTRSTYWILKNVKADDPKRLHGPWYHGTWREAEAQCADDGYDWHEIY